MLKAFASFGFCKAHAAAFALPTYHSAWLKTHHPAAFLAGVLTHDPGMYPKRLILDDARAPGHRRCSGSTSTSRPAPTASSGSTTPVTSDAGDVGATGGRPGRVRPAAPRPARCQRLRHPAVAGRRQGHQRGRGGPDRRRAALRRASADFWHRARVSRPVAERLVLAGGFDSLYGMRVGPPASVPAGWAPGRITRRDLLLHVAELDRYGRALDRSARRAAPRRRQGGPRRCRRDQALEGGRGARPGGGAVPGGAAGRGGRPAADPARPRPRRPARAAPAAPGCPR